MAVTASAKERRKHNQSRSKNVLHDATNVNLRGKTALCNVAKLNFISVHRSRNDNNNGLFDTHF